jgi:hypothetical protein
MKPLCSILNNKWIIFWEIPQNNMFSTLNWRFCFFQKWILLVSYKAMYFQFLQTWYELNFSTNSSDVDVTLLTLHLLVQQKYKIYVYDTKLAELIDNLIAQVCTGIWIYTCTFSNYQCVLNHLTDAIMTVDLMVFRNVVLTITQIFQVLIQNNSVSEKPYCNWLKGGQNNRR